MMAQLLNGRYVSNLLLPEIKSKTLELTNLLKRPPTLAVILIGENPASQIYVANKHKACLGVGITPRAYHLPTDIRTTQLLALIDTLNHNIEVDGILVQLPLPLHINPATIISSIEQYKDVDGFHPCNMGHLATRTPLLRPCTPMGIMRLLNHYNIDVRGKHAVVVGASNIVGRPMALEFLHASATVTICHSATIELAQHVRMADILVIATGIQDLIDPNWLHKNQIIIDVGIHRLQDNTLRGDLNFNEVVTKVAWLTPVPGGVGPMTIISLLENTLFSTRLLHAKRANATHRNYQQNNRI